MSKILIFLLFILSYRTMVAQDQVKLTKQTRHAVIEKFCKTLSETYVFPEKAKQMSDFIRQQEKKGSYNKLSDPNELANRLLKDVRSVNTDDHLRIMYEPELEREIVAFLSSEKGAVNVTEADIAEDEQKNFYFEKLEILPANIGYIRLNGFAVPNASLNQTIHAAMQFVAHTDALIIDLRNNFGGNATTGNQIAGYFFDTVTYTGKSFNRIENKWTDNYVRNNTGLALKMPVYFLTSNRTFSAAEGFAYTMQQLKGATVVGDTTRGGAYLTRSFSLGNGFVGFIPFARSENARTHTDWEGTGVIPTIACDEQKCLSAAIAAILEQKLSKTTDETEKRKLSYQINYNHAKDANVLVSNEQAALYTGRFAEFEVTLQNDQLVFRDVNQPVVFYKKMVAITPVLFQVGEDYQVEFILENGTCTAFNIYWDDGYFDKVIKTSK